MYTLSLLSLAVALAAACTTDSDCNLNGKCVAGTCACVSFWGGPDCGQVQFLPAAAANHAALLPSSNQSHWCAGVQFDASDKTWHLYSALMADNCGLNSWQSNSVITHAVCGVRGCG